MSTLELKEEIHKKVDSLDMDAKLFEVNHRLDLLLSSSLSEDEKFLLNRLNQGIMEDKEGKLIPHEIVSKEAKEWLHTKFKNYVHIRNKNIISSINR